MDDSQLLFLKMKKLNCLDLSEMKIQARKTCKVFTQSQYYLMVLMEPHKKSLKKTNTYSTIIRTIFRISLNLLNLGVITNITYY